MTIRIPTVSAFVLAAATLPACSSDAPPTAPPAPFRPEARYGAPPTLPPATPSYAASSTRSGGGSYASPPSYASPSYASPPSYAATAPRTSPAPAPVVRTPAAAASPAPMTDPPSFAPSAGGSFVWTASLAEAQAMARASGKLIFVEEGRPACSSCMTLKNRIIPTPEISADLGSVAVGYYDDVDANPNSQSFQILRANLPNAVMLPLCGFLTPDLRWVHGWSGGRDAPRLRAEIASARARARAFALATPPAGPAPRLASASRTPTATTAAAPARPAAAPEDPERAWARDRLGRAVDALACLDYAKARAILAEVRPRAAGLPEEKEALQGEAAIERLDRIERAETASEASRLRDDAREALAGTCWEPLFPQ